MTTEKKKTLLLVSTRRFWPADSGRKVSLYNYCRRLAEDLNYSIYVYCFLEASQDAIEDHPSFIQSVTYAKDVSKLTAVKNALKKIGDNKYPLQSFLYCDNANTTAIQALVEEVHPDVLFIDMIRLAPYIDRLAGKYRVVFDMDDILSLRYRRQQSNRGNSNVLGNYGQKSRLLSVVANSFLIRRRLLNMEAMRLEKAEVYYGEKSDAVVLVSPREVEEFKKVAPNAQVVCAPLGVDSVSRIKKEVKSKKGNKAVFVGDMYAAANYATVEYIAEEIAPLVPDVVFEFIGSCPEDLKRKYSQTGRLMFLGRVDDLSLALQSADVFLAPIAFGTGIKTKILEAMAMGIPVITNQCGAEGLSVHNNIHCLIQDNPVDIAAAILVLLDESNDIAESISQHAFDYVSTNHQWSTCTEAFVSIGL